MLNSGYPLRLFADYSGPHGASQATEDGPHGDSQATEDGPNGASQATEDGPHGASQAPPWMTHAHMEVFRRALATSAQRHLETSVILNMAGVCFGVPLVRERVESVVQ